MQCAAVVREDTLRLHTKQLRTGKVCPVLIRLEGKGVGISCCALSRMLAVQSDLMLSVIELGTSLCHLSFTAALSQRCLAFWGFLKVGCLGRTGPDAHCLLQASLWFERV